MKYLSVTFIFIFIGAISRIQQPVIPNKGASNEKIDSLLSRSVYHETVPEGFYKVFREYTWLPAAHTEGEKFLRVGGKLDYRIAPDKFSSKNHTNGKIRIADNIDLEYAVHAELLIERLQSHEGTKGLKVQINDHNWIPVHPPETLPDTPANYMFHFYPRINIPLQQLAEGYVDMTLDVDEDHPWDWPQNLIYGVMLRIYYEDEKGKLAAGISGIKNGEALEDETVLDINAEDYSEFMQVDYIGFYEDVNWLGDGVYKQWQYQYHMTKIRNHIGSAFSPPFTINWDTRWLPDQEGDIKIMGRVKTRNGLIYYTNPVEGLRLSRDHKVAIVKPYQQPERWVTRGGEFTESLYLHVNPEQITEARLYWRSWSPCYSEGMMLNQTFIHKKEEWPCYDYYEHTIKLPEPSILKEGKNTITTLRTPLHDGKMVHGMEVQWPGIMMKVKHNQPNALNAKSIIYEGKPHLMINAGEITYYYDKEGGGFSRIMDSDGNDWVSFRREPWNQYPQSASSSYRGLPNLVFTGDDGGAGHPGHGKCVSRVEGNKIVTETNSGKWEWAWEFFEDHAVLEVIKVDPAHKYWFLYEGTPGGNFNPDNCYFGTDNGGPFTTQPDYFNHEVHKGNFRWLYSGTSSASSVFYIIQMEQDDHIDFAAYLGNAKEGVESKDGMTVFAFGRDQNTNPLLSLPQKFVVGFYPERINNQAQHETFTNHIEKKFLN